MAWKPIMIAILLSTALNMSGTYWFVKYRMAQFDNQLAPLPIKINALSEQLQKWPATFAQNEQVEKRYRQLKQNLADQTVALQRNIERTTQLTQQIEQTHQAIHALLETIERKEAVINHLIPPGSIMPYVGLLKDLKSYQQLYRSGWLICDGSEYSSQQYAALSQTIQTTYGGQLSKSFKVPDLRQVQEFGLNQQNPIQVISPDSQDDVKPIPITYLIKF